MGPKKKKKLTKEEKAKLRADELERIRRDEELERERLAKEAAEALEAARIKAEDDAKREVQEQIWRVEQLEYTKEVVSTCLAQVTETECKERQEKQWEQYMKCDGLPDPASPPAMHTYLHLWRSEPKGRRNIEPVVEKTAEVLQLLNDLDELIETEGGKLLPLWREVRQKVRLEQQLRIDEATYGLLRSASTMVASVDTTMVRYHREASLYLTLTLQTDLAAPMSDAPAPSWDFDEVGVSMQLPPQFAGLHAAARALWLRYDHFTDLCPSRIPPPAPDHHSLDMKSVALELWQRRLEEKEREAEEKATLAAEEEKKRLQLEAEETKRKAFPLSATDAPPEGAQGPEEGAAGAQKEEDGAAGGEDGAEDGSEEEKEEPPPRDEEAERQKAEKEAMIKETQPCELNLRKMTVLGGVLHLDLLVQPPQPREFNKNLSLTVHAFRPIRSTLRGLEMADSANVGQIITNLTAGLQDGALEYLGLSSTGLMKIPRDALEVLSKTLLGLALQGNTFHKLDQTSFPDLPYLQTLDLRRCSILALADGAFNGLKSLRNLYLSGNRFKFVNRPFNALSKLEFLDLSNNPDPLLSDHDTVYDIKKGTFKGLDNLEVLNLAHSRLKTIDTSTFEDTPKLTTLSLCDTFIDLDSGFLSMLPNLMVLDLSNNDKLNFSPDLFRGLGNLLNLRMINCAIDLILEDFDYFLHMPNLTDLHLSHNRISHLPRNAFRSLRHLQSIHLDNNLLDSWISNTFANNTELIHIDIDHNQICYISEETASELLKMKHISFEYNPLLCDCSLHEFVQQLLNSSVLVPNWTDDAQGYTCYDPVTQLSYLIGRMPDTICSRSQALEKPEEDSGPMVAIISSTTVAAFCIILVATAIVVYKKRNNLRYFGMMVKNAMSVALMDDDHEDNPEDAIYIYDVFVSYCDADREWVIQKLLPALEQENQLRVCLHERDFQPGYGILDNIVHCIDKSRSLIIVVSKKSLKSQWCHFEMHLAQHRFIETRKDQLILVLMDDLPKNQRPRTLHYLMATRTFLLWNEKQSDLFWKRLKRVLLLEKSRAVSIV